MIELPESVLNASSPEEAAAALGQILGMDEPAPVDATRRAIKNPIYAQALLAARKMPALRHQLLVAPETISIAPPSGASKPVTPKRKVAAKAASAALKWGAAGLQHAEPWVIERRLDACNSCEFQADAPDTLMYRGAKVFAGKDAKICTQCDCLTNTKAAMATEHCPEKDPDNPKMSRWQEPWVDTTNLSQWPWR